MGEIKHTPGPWEVVRHGDDGRPSPEGGAYWVMPVASHGHGWVGDSYLNVCVGGEPRAPSNAHLIAAAPEMKEALEALISVMETTECDRLFRADYAKAKAALAKANGEAPQ